MLVTDLRQQVSAMEKSVQKKQETIQSLNEQFAELKNNYKKLELDLSLRPSEEKYREMEKRLKIIEDLEFSFERDENARSQKTIEQLLQEKNKRLQTEITGMKLALVEKEQNLVRVTEEHSQMMDKLKEQSELIKRLEEDLFTQSQDDHLSIFSASMLGVRSDIGDANSTISTSSKLWAPSDTGSGTGSSGEEPNLAMIRILSDQRNRYRKRLRDVEEQNQSLHQQISTLNTEMKRLKQDNLKLYEKIRYLESYQVSTTGPTSQGSSDNNTTGGVIDTIARRITGSASDTPNQADADLEDPTSTYRRMYDNSINESINPLSRFHKREKGEFLKRLNPAERIALSTSNLMLSNKFGRIFMFWYTIALHVLVFASLYKSIPRE